MLTPAPLAGGQREHHVLRMGSPSADQGCRNGATFGDYQESSSLLIAYLLSMP